MAREDDLTARLLNEDEYELEEVGEEENAQKTQQHKRGGTVWKHDRHSGWQNTISQLSKSWSSTRTLVAVICLVLLATLATGFFRGSTTRSPWSSDGPHPIDKLIVDANAAFSTALADGNPPTVALAAAAYRERRGRHPPPFFDKWFEWAQENNCTHIESMFDQVYEDVEPFWGAHPAKVRADAASWPVILSVRDGVIERRRMTEPMWGSRDMSWHKMLAQIPSNSLPDVDIPLNTDDKAHIFVPWEEINGYMEKAATTRTIRPADKMTQDYSSYPPPADATFDVFEDFPSEENLWLLVRDTCPPTSDARNLVQDTDLTTPSRFPSKQGAHLVAGFVSNWTAARSPCEVPDLRNLHGFFANSIRSSHMHWKRPHDLDRLVTRQFFPLFSAGKVQGSNNDIVIPPATSWGEVYFSADKTIWNEKHDEVFWRGGASGGENNETNWTRFHRHRFVSLCNGTQVGTTEQSPNPPLHVPGNEPPLPYNIPLPDPKTYPLGATSTGTSPSDLSRWISDFSDVAFTTLTCHHEHWTEEDFLADPQNIMCAYNMHWYDAANKSVPMEKMYEHKFLPDIDGHGYSGRFRSFMDSDSVPIKATIWAEWTTSRLYAWKHFVPMDNTFMDFLGLAEYFIGYTPPEELEGKVKARKGHDAEAKAIADAGREWAQQVLRKEDMVLYFWRVVLEYARAVDDRREELGFVEDLL
ncbi:Hypothetical predicted protein [Lecanosticta acicola]|uniref:Glycosyl transferase CAP10 domain-containing protein n=1 Tax=Lecanosticta acicola TaxID=111012 RepID=A0AAI9EBZ9_9PEZI|nr:Hypothetical predicted protein [Lecanosticta acicola]